MGVRWVFPPNRPSALLFSFDGGRGMTMKAVLYAAFLAACWGLGVTMGALAILAYALR